MSQRYYSVKLKHGTNEKWVKVSAKSLANASYEAQRQNSGWTVVDVRDG